MKRKGFTLIELMVVIAIIIILAAIAIPNYINMTKRAQRSRATSDAAVLATALEVYKTDTNAYPTTSGTAVPAALTVNNEYISAATMAQIVASEGAITYVKDTPASGWTITITTKDGQTGTRTSSASEMNWGGTPPVGLTNAEKLAADKALIEAGTYVIPAGADQVDQAAETAWVQGHVNSLVANGTVAVVTGNGPTSYTVDLTLGAETPDTAIITVTLGT